ncbi:MAG: hypothetical protein R3B90_01175 [Planctomycetaceae bacterium]
MDYHLRPLGKHCAGTGEPLQPGSQVISVLVQQGEDLERRDYSEAGWQGPPAGTVGQWRCRVPDAEVDKRQPLDPEALLSYLEQLLEDANPAQANMAYVVALFLLQRRRLRLEGCRVDGKTQYLELVGSHGEGPYEVRDLQLPDEELKQLQSSLTHYLQTEWKAA